MGSLCCVAARPHGSNTANGDWSVGPHEPYWRTNTSFSPPHSRWNFHRLHGSIGVCGSSMSSNSKESQSWGRDSSSSLNGHRFTASDGSGLFRSSPSKLSHSPQWTPPAGQEIDIDGYGAARRDQIQLPFSPTIEGATRSSDIGGLFSSCSDSDESEPTVRLRLSPNRNLSSRRFFLLSKAVHPLSLPLENVRGTSDSADAHNWSSATSSMDSVDVPEQIESENSAQPPCMASSTFKCGLCDKFLSQRSPWGSHRIIRSGDMPVTGVLPCQHVFHAECLEQTIPKTHKNDPPCPICIKLEGETSPFSRVRNNFPKLKPFREDEPSTRAWGCAQVGDCVESALNVPPRNTMMLLNRNRMKKNLSLRGKLSSQGFSRKTQEKQLIRDATSD